MKILKYAGIALVAILVLFLSVGLFIPRFEYSAGVLVNAAPEKCWTIMNDTTKMKKWIPGFVSFTLVNGEYLQAGSTYEIVLNQDKVYRMQETLKEVNPPQWAAFELHNEVMKSEYGFRLTVNASQTEIQAQYAVTGNNLIWRSILLLSKSYLQKNTQEQLNSLKAEIESGS